MNFEVKKNIRRPVIGVLILVSLVIFFTSQFSNKHVFAQTGVEVTDPALQQLIDRLWPQEGEKTRAQSAQNLLKNIRDRITRFDYVEVLATGFKSSLSVFLNNLAKDTAIWVASGGEGQGPLFFTKGWGPYLADLGDQALGEFVYETGRALDRTLTDVAVGEGIRETLSEGAYETYKAEIETNKADCFRLSATERQSCMLQVRQDAVGGALLKDLPEKDPANYQIYRQCEESIEAAPGNASFEEDLRRCRNLVVPSAVSNIKLEGRFFSDDSRQSVIGNTLGALAFDIARNVCAPSSIDVALKITRGLQEEVDGATCSFSTIKRNFENNVIDPNFAENFIQYHQSNSNDIGIALTLWDKQLEAKAKAEVEAQLDRLTANGIKNLEDPVTGNIKTPGALVQDLFSKAIDESSLADTTFTGTVADAIAVFVNTLAGELLDQIGRKGLVDGSGNNSSGLPRFLFGSESLSSFTSSPGTAGVSGAQLRFADFSNVRFSGSGAFEILNLLVQCPDPREPGPTECVITNNFRSAIQERLTLREAIDNGTIDGDLPLGFRGDGTTLAYNESYPYRSLIILRKYRIIPVGWELAALYIKNFGKETTSLRQVMNAFDDVESPFYRLVDPNWVLKSPENFCQAEGPGPIIIDERIDSGIDIDNDGNFLGPNDTPPEISLARDTGYCADERSCLSENPDGSCKFYGYCTQDKPVWNFQGKSCDPNFNSCKSFQAPDGSSVAYLENTLDFAGCSADNAGCQWYCEDRNPTTDEWLCSETTGSRIHFDRDVEECPAGADGCRRYLSIEPNEGINLIANSSLEDFNGEINAGIGQFLLPDTVITGHTASSEEAIIGDISAELTPNISFDIVVDTGRPLRGRTFNFSLFTNDCSNNTTFGFSDTGAVAGEIRDNGEQWQRQSISYTYLTGAQTEVELFVLDSGGNCKIDGLMLEEGDFVSPYRGYEANPATFIKTAPAAFDCSTSNLNRPSACNDFTLSCTAAEVGCTLYNPLQGGEAIPAVTSDGDFCAGECVGYDAFKQEATFLENSKFPEYFIPDSANSCSASAAGCDAFTNLDELERGGEGLENYTYLRQCVKPTSVAGASCATFFTWVGTEETGFQLITENLQQDGTGAPALVVPGTLLASLNLGECDSADDAIVNPECREYFNSAGEPSYVFWRLTRSCTDNCIPLRKADAELQNCADSGGEFDATENTCTYNAVPEESSQCSAAAAGCRAYTGNTGNNIREVFIDDFEDGAADGYVTGAISNDSIQSAGHSIVSDPNVLGTDNEVVTSPGMVAGTFVPGRTYEISFWARASNNLAKVLLETIGGNAFTYTNTGTLPNDTNINTQWNRYTIGPFVYDPTGIADPLTLQTRFVAWGVSGTDTPDVSVPRRFFMDNITVTEIRDNIYRIKNSWNTPLVCDNLINDPFGQACAAAGVCEGTAESPCRCSGPGTGGSAFTSEIPFQLGCSAYSSTDGVVTLSSFTNICKLEAVGCEAMIDTHNSTTPYDQINNAVCVSSAPVPSNQFTECTPPGFTESVCTTDENGECFYDVIHGASIEAATGIAVVKDVESTVETASDEVVYIVNNPGKYCAESEVGCSAFGDPNIGTTFNPNIRIFQGGQEFFASLFSDNSSAENIYNYNPGTNASDLTVLNGTAIPVRDESSLFAYRDDATGDLSLVFLHGKQNTGTSGTVSYTIDAPGGTLLFSDDAGELGAGSWTWGATETDGGIIDFGSGSSWEATITITDFSGPSVLSFVSGNGQRIQLDETGDSILIQYSSSGFVDQGFDFTTEYFIDNPDAYGNILCNEKEVWCQEYRTGSGNVYFKDPRANICEYRSASGSGGDKKWYKKKNNPSDPDVACLVSESKTLGLGNVTVETPIGECRGGPAAGTACLQNSDCSGGICTLFAGSCPVSESSCTEYVDPLSSFAPSLLFNGSFDQDLDSNSIPDGWENRNGALDPLNYDGDTIKANVDVASNTLFAQTIALDANTVYTVTSPIRRDDVNGNAIIGIVDETGLSNLTSPDGSMRVTGPSQVELEITHASLANTEKQYSGRFETGSGQKYTLYIGTRGATGDGHVFNSVSVRKTGIFYQFENDLDKTSCNGGVDPEAGCVLFNERKVSGGARSSEFAKLTLDADASGQDEFNSAVSACDNSPANTLCDSNVLIKVRPDRQCAEWLTCRSSVQDIANSGEVKDRCVDIALCSAFDPDTGVCTQIVPRTLETATQNLTLNSLGSPYNIDLASNLSGYSKVGITYNNTPAPNTIEGLLPFDVMLQVGEAITLENGNFEQYSNSGQPVGWTSESVWSPEEFQVIRDPFTAEQLLGRDLNRAPEGRSFLQVGSSFTATTEFMQVSGGTSYTLSGFINTVNLGSGNAEIIVEEYDTAGTIGILNFSQSAVVQNTPFLESGRGWQFKIGQFTTDPATTQLRIRLKASAGINTIGTFYYDDVKLKPGLRTQAGLVPGVPSTYCETGAKGTECFSPQECRLFPREDSLSCGYFDDSGLRVTGWPGYCIEHDPLNPNVCLEWWPVDKVIGEEVSEEGVGYTDRNPLYMCLNAKPDNSIYTITGAAQPAPSACQGFIEYGPILGEKFANINNIVGVDFVVEVAPSAFYYDAPPSLSNIGLFCIERGVHPPGAVARSFSSPCTSNSQCSGTEVCADIFQYTSDHVSSGISGKTDIIVGFPTDDLSLWKEIYIYDGSGDCGMQSTGELRFVYDVKDNAGTICTDIAQVVTISGKNTAWTGRLAQGSSYIIPGGTSVTSDEVNISLSSDYTPFGGAVNPEPQGIPEAWDSKVSRCVNPNLPFTDISNATCVSSADCNPPPGPGQTLCSFIGNDPLFIETPDRTAFENPPHQVRAGTPYACTDGASCPIGRCLSTNEICTSDAKCSLNLCCTPERGGDCLDPAKHPYPLSYANSDEVPEGVDLIKRIFAQSYGTWNWDATDRQYKVSSNNWTAPNQICPVGGRPGFPNDLCGVPPFIANITLSAVPGPTGLPSIDNTGFTTLSFTTDADFNQLPLTRMKLDWGDNQTSIISGVRMRDRTNPASPHRFFHLYSYWDLIGKADDPTSTLSCNSDPARTYQYCDVQIRIQAKDNWGWCNAEGAQRGRVGSECDTAGDAWTDPIIIEVRQ